MIGRSFDLFVLYQADDVLDIGTAEELAKKRSTTPRAIRTLATPKRLARERRTRDSQQVVAIRVPLKELV